MADTGTPTVTSPGVDPGTATPKADVTFVKAEDFDGYRKMTNQELQDRRKRLDALDAKIEAITEKLGSFSHAATATSDSKNPKDLQTAETERRVKALEEQLAEAGRKRAEALISSAISDATRDVLPGVRKILQDSLRLRAKLDGDAVVADTPDGPRRMDAEYVRSLEDSNSWFPGSGKPGTGLKDSGTATGGTGIDPQKALDDPEYFAKHKADILAAYAAGKLVSPLG